MAKKIKWFAAGFVAHSLFSGNNKKALTPEEEKKKLQEYDNFLNSHPLFSTLIFIVVAACLVWVLVKSIMA